MAMLELLSGAIATNGKPSLSTDGVPIRRNMAHQGQQGFWDGTQKALLLHWFSAGTGTLTSDIRLWGYFSKFTRRGVKVTVGKWFPLGVGSDSTKGEINATAQMGETDTDSLTHSEILENFMAFDRLYAQIVGIGGTDAASNLILVAGADQ